QQEVIRHLRLAEAMLDSGRLSPPDMAYLRRFAQRVSRATGCRVTLIDSTGRVLVDSDIAPSQIGRLDNHLHRPEVQAALKHPEGTAVRYSVSLGRSFVYACRKLGEPAWGFLRLALPEEIVGKHIGAFRLRLLGVGVIIGVVAALAWMIHLSRMYQDIQQLRIGVQPISPRSQKVTLPHPSDPELAAFSHRLERQFSRLLRELQSLDREKNELRTILASIKDGIIAIDAHRRIMLCNEVARQMLDDLPRNPAQRYFYQVIRNPHLHSLINRFFEQPFLMNDRIETDQGTVLEVDIVPFREGDASGPGAVVVLRDVTQMHQLEKIRRDFVANVSHEFKTPLTAVRGYAETLLDWALERSQMRRKYVEKILQHAIQLENLVNDLLQLARIERMSRPELQPFDPLPILREVAETYREAARRKGLSFSLSTGEAPPTILGEPEMFRSILANLIDNAIKYTPSGGSVAISWAVEENSCTFMVRDTGIGIPQSEQERIFERFYRVDKARSRSIGGTGLGLSIVKHLAELQQAEVWVNSEENQGSCFGVVFQVDKLSGNLAVNRKIDEGN
ncbi:MAG: PAS domain-containing protein, partial [Calditrichaeota bacterium]